MKELRATYRLTTPAFVGGADNGREADLRPPTIKAQLRFWWRAIMWARLGGDMNALQEREDALFGSIRKGGQAAFLMEVRPLEQVQTHREGNTLTYETSARAVDAGARYLGYGVMEAFGSRNKGTSAGQLTRPALRTPLKFTVHARFKPTSSAEHIRELEEAMTAWGAMGAMGSKARKGYGSISLVKTELYEDRSKEPSRTTPGFSSIGSRVSYFEDLLSQSSKLTSSSDDVPFSAISTHTRITIIEGAHQQEPLRLLNQVGSEQVRYRSWGRNGKILGDSESSEKNFEPDHDQSKDKKGRHAQQAHPKRVAFGLPHNYGKGQEVSSEDHDRRASPLFIHIDQPFEDQPPVAVLTLMPSLFLPQATRIKAFGNAVELDRSPAFWKTLEDFLHRFSPPNYNAHHLRAGGDQ